MQVTQIGVIHTPFREQKGTPIQPRKGKGVTAKIEVFDEYVDGLKDLDGFSHIIILFYFHKSEGYSLQVIPYLDTKPRGLFSTRAPKRPSQIGLSIVKLKKVEGNILTVEDVDMLDGTPLLDIKPYVPPFDEDEEFRIGWLEGRIPESDEANADDRF